MSAAGSSTILRVLTLNVRYDKPGDGLNRWERRRDRVAKHLREFDVDLAGLQEVRRRQLQELLRRLPDYEAFGVGRDDGRSSGEFSPILYRRERFERLDQGTFWLSTQPQRRGSVGWDARHPRICTWVRFRDRSSGKTFQHFNTHFDLVGRVARIESSRLLRRQIHHRAAGFPAWLTGDFNCAPGSPPYEMLTRPLAGARPFPALRDARRVSRSEPEGPDSTWNDFRAIVPGRRIDHVFVSPDVDVQSYRVVDTRDGWQFSSDHLPVVVELQLP